MSEAAAVQSWVGTNLAWLLSEIGGWHVDCQNHDEHRAGVRRLVDDGLIRYRMHYAKAWPEGVRAFEVTDRGIEALRGWGWDADAAAKTRQWYRDHSSRPLSTTSVERAAKEEGE